MAENKGVQTLYFRAKLAKYAGGGMTHIAVGDGGLSGGQPSAPSGTQAALKHEIGRYALAPVTYPTETTVRYMIEIPADDLPDAKISEMALVDNAGKLCSIRNCPAYPKEQGVVLRLEISQEF